MKHHKQFRAALLVSIQERQAQYPEMTDADFERALRTLADRSERERRQRLKAEADAAWEARCAQIRAARVEAEKNPTTEQQRLAAESRRRMEEKQRRQSEEIQRREAEAQEERKARQAIIRAGRKVFAQKQHPDKGGSTQQMIKLIRARDALLRGH